MEKLKQEFKDRVWKSWKSTLVGVALGLASAIVNDVLIPWLGGQPQPWARALYGLTPVLGGLLKSAAVKAEADTKLFPGVPPAALVLLLGGLLLATPAQAQTSPVYGGCFNESKSICAGPGATLSLVGLDLKKGEIVTGLITGVGYEITFFSQQWYRTGVGVYGNLSATSSGTSGLFSGIVSFANFVRVGLGEQIIGAGPGNGFAASPTLLFGIGSDFGRL